MAEVLRIPSRPVRPRTTSVESVNHTDHVPNDEPCPECGFDPSAVADLAAEIDALGRKLAAPLTRYLPGEDGPALVRTRPDPETWSPLEYACHVRDVLRLFDQRTASMVTEPGVRLGSWDHEAAVVDNVYNDEDPAVVAGEIADASAAYASTLRDLDDEQWSAAGERDPGDVVTVDTLARQGLHEARHHQLDIGRGLRSARGR